MEENAMNFKLISFDTIQDDLFKLMELADPKCGDCGKGCGGGTNCGECNSSGCGGS